MTDEKTKLSNVAAIRKYFPDADLQELKKLSAKDREELGALARAELEKQK